MTKEKPRAIVPGYAQRVARYKADGSWTSDTLDREIDRVVEANRNKLAVVDAYGSLTYGQLQEQADRVACQLSRRGIGRGDVVTVQLPNRKEFPVILYALARLGAVLHPANIAYRQHELIQMMNLAGTKAMITTTVFRNFDHAAMAEESRPEVPGLEQVYVVGEGDRHGLDAWELLLEPVDAPLKSAGQAEDVLVLLYTSGTTGKPKGVMHTHCTVLASGRDCTNRFGLTGETVGMLVVPVGMAFGIGTINNSLLPGGSLVMLEAFTAEGAVEMMTKHGVTFLVAVPAMLLDIMKSLEGKPKSALPPLKLFGYAGAAVPRELLLKAREMFGCTIISIYGMSENIGHTCTPLDAPMELISNTVGTVYPHQEIAILDASRQPCPTGVTGEIAARGAHQFVGYYGEPEMTAACHTPDDWFLTGDLGLIGEDGYVRIVGRKKEMIIRGGLNIDPREIEDLLRGHPMVRDVAVIGIPDERLGEKACACVIPAKPGADLTLADVVTHLRGQGISNQKLPERLEVVSEFPLTVTMKVRKATLREQVVAKMEAEKAADTTK